MTINNFIKELSTSKAFEFLINSLKNAFSYFSKNVFCSNFLISSFSLAAISDNNSWALQ